MLKVIDKIPKIFLHFYSLILVVVGWGIFYFTNLTQMQHFFYVFFGRTEKIMDFAAQTALFNNFWLWVAGIIFSMPVYDFVNKHFSKIKSETLRANIALVTRVVISLCLLFLSVALLVGATNNAFIYTRF